MIYGWDWALAPPPGPAPGWDRSPKNGAPALCQGRGQGPTQFSYSWYRIGIGCPGRSVVPIVSRIR